MTVVARQTAVLLALFVAACGPSPVEVQYAQVAEHSAMDWLAHVDSGDYGGSWDLASSVFQARTSKQQWESMAHAVRLRLNQPADRELVAARYVTTMGWEPPGEHVLVQYRLKFGARPSVETLLMRRDDDEWKTSSYAIRLDYGPSIAERWAVGLAAIWEH